jgi:glycine cleavage system H protein
MTVQPTNPVYYKRSRFATRLPTDRLYSPSHFWMREVEPGLWRVGFTKFATRMLGDLVEHGFGVKEGEPVALGQEIGWVEGFKAITDIYSVLTGEFIGGNESLRMDITLADTDPYDRGWIYAIRGTPDPNATDVHGYASMLDLTIDKMQSDAARQSDPCP